MLLSSTSEEIAGPTAPTAVGVGVADAEHLRDEDTPVLEPGKAVDETRRQRELQARGDCSRQIPAQIHAPIGVRPNLPISHVAAADRVESAVFRALQSHPSDF